MSSDKAKKIVIIGATSGIGRALACEMHHRGYVVGATGRRQERLQALKQELGERLFIQAMDVSRPGAATEDLEVLLRRMKSMDIIVLNAGISTSVSGSSGRCRDDLEVIAVNVNGFAGMAAHAFERFEEQGYGHLVGVSSIASLFGWGASAPYNASKAFVNRYLQGYRQKARHSTADIAVTNLVPGYVESEMTKGRDGLFWAAPASRAARQMADAIERQLDHSYITRRWRLVAWLLKLTPQWIWTGCENPYCTEYPINDLFRWPWLMQESCFFAENLICSFCWRIPEVPCGRRKTREDGLSLPVPQQITPIRCLLPNSSSGRYSVSFRTVNTSIWGLPLTMRMKAFKFGPWPITCRMTLFSNPTGLRWNGRRTRGKLNPSRRWIALSILALLRHAGKFCRRKARLSDGLSIVAVVQNVSTVFVVVIALMDNMLF
ncbi:SDR family NAD(P)-dependent oxidoreductase [Fodinibius sediminis]|uniref:SDR family NAD(P)-dependent oxidoreductase n=1 Tax=Fodinibius sediminis TaxID=1214077 RepID=UPI00163D6E7A|nr:SDR family NAD(P)-dependent oxidoreductase [Fodinibius sediminis]